MMSGDKLKVIENILGFEMICRRLGSRLGGGGGKLLTVDKVIKFMVKIVDTQKYFFKRKILIMLWLEALLKKGKEILLVY